VDLPFTFHKCRTIADIRDEFRSAYLTCGLFCLMPRPDLRMFKEDSGREAVTGSPAGDGGCGPPWAAATRNG
jgi:hypothetical protein